MWFENQFPYFLWMILCGTGIMFFYDFLRIGRRLTHHPDFLVNIEDVLYACICAVVVFYVTYLKNNGELRIQTVFGLILGCLLYILIVRDKFVRLGLKVVRCILKILKQLVKIILFPFNVIYKILRKPARFVIWYTGKGVRCVGNKAVFKMKNLKHIIRRK